MAESEIDYAEQIRHLVNSEGSATAVVVGSERFALDKQWFENCTQAPSLVNPEEVGGEVVWIPQSALAKLETWFGPLPLKRARILGENEYELDPTFCDVEVRTGAEDSAPVAKLDAVSAAEEVPALVRRALDAADTLKFLDEEDVRLWVRKQGESEYRLVACDLPKAMPSSTSLRDEEEAEGEGENTGAVLTLRGVVGPILPAFSKQRLFLLLEVRQDGKFTRPVPGILTSAKPLPTTSSSSSSIVQQHSRKKQSFIASSPVKVGQRCDVLRGADSRWLEAMVVEVAPSTCRVHFLSFPASADEHLPLTPTISPNIQPPHTKVPDWRQQLKVGDIIDVHTSALRARVGGSLYQNLRHRLANTKSRWIPCTVRRIERNREDPRVTIGIGLTNKYFGPEHLFQIGMDSELIAARHTHVVRPKSFTLGPQSTPGTPPLRGIVGLRNLGNTCYMNSVLQCLSHCTVLREHFLSGAFEADINRRNPLGMGGQLAESFSQLLQQIWSSEFQVVAPNKFKITLGQMNSQFQGFSQHDSQELLTQLLDCLHEDLNRVLKKPVTNPVESAGKSDLQVYNESWDAFQQRNESKIVSEMYGMMKSHLLCPVCGKEAVTFDAYANVSVPIPSLSLVRVDFIFLNVEQVATRCVALLPKRAPAHALVDWICQNFPGVQSDDLVVGELIANKVGTFFHRIKSAGSVLEEDEVETKSTVRELSASPLLLAWQLPTVQATQAEAAPAAVLYPELEASWNAFWSGLDKIASSASSLQSGAETCIKDYVAQEFNANLGFPFRFAQQRLVTGLAQLKNKKVAQRVAGEACRLIEAEAHAVLPQLVKEAGAPPPSENGSANRPSALSESAMSTESPPATTITASPPPVSPPMTRKSMAPLRFFTRLFSSPSPTSGNIGSSPGGKLPQNKMSTLKNAALCDANARIIVELNHFRTGQRNSRVPSFVCIRANCTWGELHEKISAFLHNVLLKGFVPTASAVLEDGNAAAGAAQLELDTTTTSNAGDSGGGNGDFFTLELDSVDRAPFPLPFIPLLENLGQCKSATANVNSLSIVVRWTNAEAMDFVFGTAETGLGAQLEENARKVVDGTLGLGQVQLHASVAQAEATVEEGEQQRQGAITLDQCLEAFRRKEQLGIEDAWFCDQCKTHQCAYKTMNLWNTPNVLVIHLKRFLYERTLGERVQREKINDLVTFPLTDFDTRPLLAGDGNSGRGGVYDLFAVSNHMGGLGSGHYVAYVKSEEDGSWWHMNDSIVTRVEDVSQVVSNSAYVLFYKKRV